MVVVFVVLVGIVDVTVLIGGVVVVVVVAVVGVSIVVFVVSVVVIVVVGCVWVVGGCASCRGRFRVMSCFVVGVCVRKLVARSRDNLTRPRMWWAC